jgi:hypothetical protein
LTDVNRNRKLIAGTAAVALLAGGGAAFAAMKLISSRSSSPSPQAPIHMGVDGFGLGGRLGGRGFGGGLGGEAPRPRRGFGFAPFRAGALAPLTAYLGLSSSALESDLGKGETLAQIANAQGKSVGGLVTALLAARKRELDQAVSAGRLTAAQEQQIESSEAERVRELVNGAPPRALGGPGGATFASPIG